MSAVTVAVLIGFVCCALIIRALSVMEQDSDSATERVRIFGDTPYRAMMDE
ncbi:hypothetical protein [Nocardia pseudovaccinii]|uniref:hypothetical protein n=1 Tax=Nocardia pseudovaccinii TaxID=189540 RepID=UPI000AC8D720|nr:hypothetical protein [Nocardia pseudovaccinii]